MERIFLSRADVSELEEEAVTRAIRSGWVAPLGPEVDAFEQEIAEYVGVKSALALNSGTSGLHLALLGYGVGPGTVVPVSTLTFAATVNAIIYTGASPYFVDCQEDGNINPDLLKEAVEELLAAGEKVPAVVVVDLLGRVADYREFDIFLRERGIALIEDAAESLGAAVDGKRAGRFGDAAVLSFNGNKIMTTSGGGMLLSDDQSFIDRARYLATQARQPVPWYEHTEVGYNYRLSGILAALGRAQLSRLDSMIEVRRQHRRHYRSKLTPGFCRLLSDSDERFNDNCWLTSMVINEDLDVTPDQLITALNEANIEARHLWKPMHQQPAYKKARGKLDGTSDGLFSKGVTLPSGSELSSDQVAYVISEIEKALS